MTKKAAARSGGTDEKALRFLRTLTERFPSFIGTVADRYELRSRLDDILAHRNMGTDTVRVESMTADVDTREFGAVVVPQEGCSLLSLSHIGIPVQGTRDGYIYRVEEIAQVAGIDPRGIKSVLPAQGGMAHVELTVPIMMSCKVPPDKMREALARVCQNAESTGNADTDQLSETEQALQAAERGLEAEVKRLRGKGKSLIEIEAATQGMRETVKRLKDECEEERKAGGDSSIGAIVNPDAPFAAPGDDLTVTGVQGTLLAFLNKRSTAGLFTVKLSDIYGTAEGLEPHAMHLRCRNDISTDGPDVILGHVIEHTLADAGWQGTHDAGATVWVLPQRKPMLCKDPEPAAE